MKPGSWLKEIAIRLAIALVAYLLVSSLVEMVQVHGPSSYPNLQEGDLIVADRAEYHLGGPERGQFVIAQTEEGRLIKRVVGLPGERLRITPQGIFINGEHLDEPYLHGKSAGERWPLDGGDYVVPPDQYFLLGDNRDDSSDSRTLGAIPRQDIEARALVRLWPLSRFSFVG